tara:strand:- start:329 stop:523 length:195 start_codon:yes stop_codon:yes gene_type:complete
MKVVLNSESQAFLRKAKMINDQEVAYKFGDLFIAENSITGTKRQLQGVPEFVIENSLKPGLLKG